MYHWLAKFGIINAKRERWSKKHKIEEQSYLSKFLWMPSPKGKDTWKTYIKYRIEMMQKAMDVYATRKYSRTKLYHYMESNRASDNVAKELTKGKPAVAMVGGANISPSSPIGIRKCLRVPGTRKLINSFKKLGNVVVIFVDEYFTSQTCAKCFKRFDRATKRNRFKVCRNCVPIEHAGITLPDTVVCKKGKRQLRHERLQKKAEILREHDERRAAGQNNVDEPVQHAVYQAPLPRLVSKIQAFFKLMLNDNDEWEYVAEPTTNWHRDIVAAKCILYKGNIDMN